MEREPSVCAVIVTYDAPDYATACVDALLSQEPRPAEVLVIDNGTLHADLSHHDQVTHLIIGSNTGPAGGFAIGMTRFLNSTHTHVWLMDDDLRPDAACLATLLLSLGDDEAVIVPTLFDQDWAPMPGRLGWAAILTTRAVIERVGVPIAELFWGAEDDEWLLHRCGEIYGMEVRRDSVARARMHVRDLSDPKPAWKYYYEARNVLYVNLYRREGLRLQLRLKVLAVRLARLARRAWGEPPRADRYRSMALGLAHGLVGRLGPRVRVGPVDRPHL